MHAGASRETLFGLGSADMKSGLAAMLYAAVALHRLRVPLDGRVGLVFVPDEETGGRRGSGYLAATKRLGTDGIGMLTPEPTSGVVSLTLRSSRRLSRPTMTTS